jgi:hypothetical protein
MPGTVFELVPVRSGLDQTPDPDTELHTLTLFLIDLDVNYYYKYLNKYLYRNLGYELLNNILRKFFSKNYMFKKLVAGSGSGRNKK